MKKILKYTALIIGVPIILVLGVFLVQLWLLYNTSPPKLIISEETTHITEPLDEKGYVIYPAAYNERYGKGVTAENNAFVGVFTALGPGKFFDDLEDYYEGDEIEEHRQLRTRELHSLCSRIGIEQLPIEGDYFINEVDFLKEKFPNEGQVEEDYLEEPPNHMESFGLSEDELISPLRYPWKKEDYPLLARWIALNQKPLDKMVEASRCDRWFYPVEYDEEVPTQLIALSNDALEDFRSANLALLARGMMRLEEGDTEGAWQDVSAVARLGSLSATTRTLIDRLTANTILQMANDTAATLIADPRVTATQRQLFLAEYGTLPAFPPLAAVIDTMERWSALEMAIYLTRYGGYGEMDQLTGSEEADNKMADYYYNAFIDLNIVLPIINEGYDKLVRAAQEPDLQKQRELMDALEEELVDNSRNLWKKAGKFLTGRGRQAQSEVIAEMFLGLFMPCISLISETDFKLTMTSQMVPVVSALADYRDKNGDYPEKLDALVPEYIDTIPKDIFAEKEPPLTRVIGVILQKCASQRRILPR